MQSEQWRAVYEAWLLQHYQDVYSWCFRMTRNQEDAEDLAQETFLIAYRKMHMFRGDASPKTWLLKIAVRLCLKAIKRRTAAHIPMEWTTPSYAPSAECEASARFDREELWRCVAKLPPREQAAVLLYHAQGQSYLEIAEIMDVSVERVKNYLHRGRRHLKTALYGEGEQGEISGTERTSSAD
ncbi:MAG: RNA polymerase sigma factor [Bacilli bacterium]